MTESMPSNFLTGQAWYKLWYIWQRLDDTYGNTWYAGGNISSIPVGKTIRCDF